MGSASERGTMESVLRYIAWLESAQLLSDFHFFGAVLVFVFTLSGRKAVEFRRCGHLWELLK